MKKLFLLLVISASLFSACQNNNTSQAVETGEAQDAAAASAESVSYAVDADASIIKWEGYKPGKYSHYGTINVQAGKIAVNNGVIEGGSFIIDMNSLTDLDVEDPERKAKLEGHLKSGDFFEVEKYPTATFNIVKVEPLEGNADATHKITGNLTMKDITKSVEIPARVVVQDGALMATTPEFVINRTDWNVSFNSGLLGAVGDALIADDVKLMIELSAGPRE